MSGSGCDDSKKAPLGAEKDIMYTVDKMNHLRYIIR